MRSQTPSSSGISEDTDDDALALLGQVDDQLVDLVFRAHVDAAGRLVQQQHLRLGQEPAADDDLLLVAAGEGNGSG